jgi:hypothetical protein
VGIGPIGNITKQNTGGEKQSPWTISRRPFVEKTKQATKNNHWGYLPLPVFCKE